jgi:hypothetical protein
MGSDKSSRVIDKILLIWLDQKMGADRAAGFFKSKVDLLSGGGQIAGVSISLVNTSLKV